MSEVCIVHCIDAEGPLFESFEAKFERLHDLYGITGIAPTKKNFLKLQRGEIGLGGIEKIVAQTFTSHLMNYNDTWDKIDLMTQDAISDSFRNQLKDSYGNGWCYNWFCLDFVGFEYNPRRRDFGYHNIFNYYKEIKAQNPDSNDSIHWHFHPISIYKDAHHCATSFVNSTYELYQVLCRRIIEKNWFPTAFRAGFQAERPDSNLFLEQWVPFDISNMALEDNSEFENTIDFKNGRSGDWRLAPSDWSIYHPHHDNYQLHGNCRRWIARALNILNRIANIDQHEMDKAFKKAQDGTTVLVGVVSHDFRDYRPDVDHVRKLIAASAKQYPNVPFRYCETIDAFRRTIYPEGTKEYESLDFDITFHPKSDSDVPYIEVKVKKGEVFGPQPFLAIQTFSRRFIHDNFDFSTSPGTWYYAFHSDTLPIDDVAIVGVAANDNLGNVCIRKLQFKKNGKVKYL